MIDSIRTIILLNGVFLALTGYLIVTSQHTPNNNPLLNAKTSQPSNIARYATEYDVASMHPALKAGIGTSLLYRGFEPQHIIDPVDLYTYLEPTDFPPGVMPPGHR